jgi:UPF0716 protein FxsA
MRGTGSSGPSWADRSIASDSVIAPILFLLFIVGPIVELYVLVQVAQAIGVVEALGLMVLVSMLGAWLARREGLRTWRRFTEQARAGATPSRELADGLCVLLGGALLLAPGFVTDVIGLVLLFPPTRALVRGVLVRRMTGRVSTVRATYGGRIYDASARDDTTRGELDP